MCYIFKIYVTIRALNHLHRVHPWRHQRLQHIPGRGHSGPGRTRRRNRLLRSRHHSSHMDSDCGRSSQTSSSNCCLRTSSWNMTSIHNLRTANQNTTLHRYSTTSSWRNSSSQRCYNYTKNSGTHFACSRYPQIRSRTGFFSRMRALYSGK